MLYSRIQLVNECKPASNPMNAILQDTYDGQDDEEQSNDASFENFYDAQTESALPEVRIDMEPSERLCEAIEALREVIMENTSVQKTSRQRRGRSTQSGLQSGYKANGSAMSLKDERLKIRKEKVGTFYFNLIC